MDARSQDTTDVTDGAAATAAAAPGGVRESLREGSMIEKSACQMGEEPCQIRVVRRMVWLEFAVQFSSR